MYYIENSWCEAEPNTVLAVVVFAPAQIHNPPWVSWGVTRLFVGRTHKVAQKMWCVISFCTSRRVLTGVRKI